MTASATVLGVPDPGTGSDRQDYCEDHDRDLEAVRAEHARLAAETAQAQARYGELQSSRPDLGDREACEAHQALEHAASKAIQDAMGAEDAYLYNHPELVPVYETARRLHACGISVIPIGPAKKPDLPGTGKSWKQYQERLPVLDELHEWFSIPLADCGLASICGKISGGLEMFELEGRALSEGILEEFTGYLAGAGLTGAWQRILDGYSEMTPSGGLHVLWRCAEISRNTKLAARPASDAELKAEPKHKVRDLIETRGEGGYVVLAPSPGGCHPSGKPWMLGAGSPETIPTITAEEREGIFAAARKCSKMPPGRLHERPPPALERDGKGKPVVVEGHRPCDVFRREATWAEILGPAGWALDYELDNGEKRWRRPGKAAGEGHSAITGNPAYPGDNLFVFSTSTQFEPETPYDKFTAYALLYHGGDLAAAEKTVQEQGCRDDRQILPSPKTPLPAAQEIARTHYADDSGRLLLRWHREDFYRWTGTYWRRMGASEVHADLYRITGNARVYAGTDEETGEEIYNSWNPNKMRIAHLAEALALGVAHLDPRTDSGAWVKDGMDGYLIPMANGLLDRDTRLLHPHSPEYFNTWALPYDYDEKAPSPQHFLRFLEEIFPGGQASQHRLLELFGLYLSGDMSFEKIGAFLGSKRSGKGTCMRVLKGLLGHENVATVTLPALASHFGMESLIGKPLAIIPDSRYNGRDADVVVSRLLMISGEDSPDVPRKNRTDWRGTLPTRLLMASNLMPRLRDESGVIASRFVTLFFAQDFTGREDRKLTERLLRELPGILNLALDGLDRLREQGRFTVTENAEEDLEEMERASSREKGFVYDCCETGRDFQEEKRLLYERFKAWNTDQGYRDCPDLPTFMRNLKGAFPALQTDYRLPRQPDGSRPRGPLRGIRLREGARRVDWDLDRGRSAS